MNPMTIQCARCSACLVLGPDVLERLRGRTGRLPCHGCGEKIRLDGTQEDLHMVGARPVEIVELELDEPASARGEQLSLLPLPPDLRDEPEEEAHLARSLPPPPPHRSSLRPPRPSGLPRPRLQSNPFDELGTLAPVVPLQGVRLTEDGRLVNRADDGTSKKPRSRMRTWAPLAAAGLLATGFASARVGSILPLGGSRAPQMEYAAARTPAAESMVPRATSEGAQLTSATSSPAPDALHAPVVADPVAAAPASKVGKLSLLEGAPEEAADTESRVSPVSDEGALRPSDVPSESDEAPSSDAAETESEGAEAPAAESAAEPSEDGTSDTPEGPAFSREAATVALQHAEAEALGCRQPGDPAGSARVVVTFAPSGRVTSANVSGAPFAGTATGGCIAGRFRAATVPAFVGGHVTVTKTISVQ